jgi:hypothetical protein
LQANAEEEKEDEWERRERRMREEQAIREADLKNAEDMFSGVTVKGEHFLANLTHSVQGCLSLSMPL